MTVGVSDILSTENKLLEIERSTKRLNDTIQRLQTSSKAKNNRIKIKCVSCDLKNAKLECVGVVC